MILIALGGNLPSCHGEPEETLLAARDALVFRGLTVSGFSSVWLSAPVPASDQPWYRNAVMSVETRLGAPALMALLQSVEEAFGRVRVAGQQNAARVLDLDILAYQDQIFHSADLLVPHPRMQDRGFVLYPLQEIAPDWVHPVLKRSVTAMIESLPAGQEIMRSQDVAA